MAEPISRRGFLVQSALYGSSLWVLLNVPRPRAVAAAQASTHPEVLTESEWNTVEAITSRIIPTDHEPGAVEANCVNFIDKALAHEDAAMTPLYRSGVTGVDAVSRRRFAKPFVELAAEERDEILVALESDKAEGWPKGGAASPAKFFEMVRAHTIMGFLAHPKYGGNRDYAGWKVAGYPGGGHHLGGYSPEQLMGKVKIKTAWGEEV
jgi:gluconate 2-dehydrogenase gamma chain